MWTIKRYLGAWVFGLMLSTPQPDLASMCRPWPPFVMLFRRVGLRHMLPPSSSRTTRRSDGLDEIQRSFILRIVQPGLAGLMDGSVSTLAPLFATAFVTHSPLKAFLVGMAAATGAGISMAFAEALSDNGEWTGRGKPWLRGGVIGIMTFFGGSLHTLPCLLPDLQTALLAAYVVVAVELVLIATIRRRFFGTHWGLSIFQVVGSGVLVFVAAILFGNA